MTFTSVWEGHDGPLLDKMLEFYVRGSRTKILDASFNAGRIWKGSTNKPSHTMDISPPEGVTVDYQCDNQIMPGVPDAMFDVVVYDPPHVGGQGRDKSKLNMDGDFGANMACLKEHGYTLSHLYPGFLTQANRVLRDGGLVFAKITDQVNNHRTRWAHVDFLRMAEESGFTACDMIIKVRKGPAMSSKWKDMRHARKRHCYWIILRKGKKCE